MVGGDSPNGRKISRAGFGSLWGATRSCNVFSLHHQSAKCGGVTVDHTPSARGTLRASTMFQKVIVSDSTVEGNGSHGGHKRGLGPITHRLLSHPRIQKTAELAGIFDRRAELSQINSHYYSSEIRFNHKSCRPSRKLMFTTMLFHPSLPVIYPLSSSTFP